jgi:hypothetical protein
LIGGRDCYLEIDNPPDGPARILVLDDETTDHVWLLGSDPAAPGQLVWSTEILLPNGAELLTEETSQPQPVRLVPLRAVGRARGIPLGGPMQRPSAPLDDDFAAAAAWSLALPADALDGGGETLLQIDYEGDVARLYAGDTLLADHFWSGLPWQIGLRRFADLIAAGGLRLEILPLQEKASIHLSPQVKPTFANGQALQVLAATTRTRRYLPSTAVASPS